MNNLFSFLLLSLFVLNLSSCVTYRKYEDAITERDQVNEKYETQSSELKETQQLFKEIQEEYQSQSKQYMEVQRDLRTARERYDRLDRSNRDLLERYDRMFAQNEKMLQTTTDEKQQLLSELNAKQLELDNRERELKMLENQVNKKEQDVNYLKLNLQDRENRVQELERIIAEKEAALDGLKDKVNEALLGFSASDLSVREENGKLYVSLSQNLLFSSGSKYINGEGKKAISKLALVLKQNPDIEITVEGHTDTDGDPAYNWDLSVGRATSVVKELTKNGVQPKRITAAGRGEFYPIASNKNANGKARNRRTEIILSPNLDELYNMMK